MTTKEAVELYRHAYKKASDAEWEAYQKAPATPEEARKRQPAYKNPKLSQHIDKTVATAKPGYLKQMLREGGRIRQGEAKADQLIKDRRKAINDIISGNFKKPVTNQVVNVAKPSGQGS